MQGYYRWPALCRDTIIFGSEDDLWTVPASGGLAARLTANLATIGHPFFSPDGTVLAFTAREEGPAEVYTMPPKGGPMRRVTYLGCASSVIGWTPDGASILFSSDWQSPHGVLGVYSVSPDGGIPTPWPVGLAVSISITSGNRTVIGRNSADPARWKRYRGGMAGDLWIDPSGSGEFRRLISLKGNLARPMWLGERVYFLSDHEGVGNLYSCDPEGADLQRHTHHADFFVRFPSTDGDRIVYHAGGDLYLYDAGSGQSAVVPVAYHSPRTQRQRRFVEPAKYLEAVSPHPAGHSVAVTSRGGCYVMGNWEGSVTCVAAPAADDDGQSSSQTRHRCARFLRDGIRIVAVGDTGGEETIEVHDPSSGLSTRHYPGLDIGRAWAVRPSPTADEVVIHNQRNELLLLDLESGEMRVIDSSPWSGVGVSEWSPDGRWLAYSFPVDQYRAGIRIWGRESNEATFITDPVLHDLSPAFDPEGRYLYFIGVRELNPVYDGVHFDLGFPKGTRPFLVTLQSDTLSPFAPTPRPLKEQTKGPTKPDATDAKADSATTDAPKAVRIDMQGIQQRVLPFPVPEGLYRQISGIKGKVLFSSFPVEGALGQNTLDEENKPKGTLEVFDFENLKHEPLIQGISSFEVAPDRSTLYLRCGERVRVLAAGEKPDDKVSSEGPSRRSGWLDLGRIRISVSPGAEWRQMAREAWRLQREHFWTADMSQIDWDAVWSRYLPLLDRVGTRAEFSDLMWEMQGELGTSHAYEAGGDHRAQPAYSVGFLGGEFAWSEPAHSYVVTKVIEGCAAEVAATSPLLAPGVNVRVGDRLLAINHQPLSQEVVPEQYLVNCAGLEISLTVQSGEAEPRTVTVRTLRSEKPLRYREWVNSNRRYVHERSAGRVGYVHIPDMGARGYAEFHRLYLTEVAYDAMIVDVRFNGGGHVSPLILEKLARRRLGYDVPRWGAPEPYPSPSVAGPMVMLTNQFAGSDGDIVSHCFKLMKLGRLIGKRTWGGVIGIWPRNPLADGTVTTQPEFSFWFTDVGWGVENYGTDPDIDVDIAPQHYAAGVDPQLDKALEVITEELETSPPLKPDFGSRPSLRLPNGPAHVTGEQA